MRLASLTSALVLFGCANQGDEGMIVLNNTAVAGTTCEMTGAAGQPFLSHGEIYALSNRGYTLTPLIQSRVTMAMGSTSNPLQKTIALRGADISLMHKAVSIETNGSFAVTNPESNLGDFSVLFSGSLPPDGTVNVGFEIITPAIMRNILQMAGVTASQKLNAEVLAEVTIKGTLGGNDISASPFFFPVSVCTDCVVNVVGACPATVVARTGNACNIYQDGVVDCCTGANGLVCPAPMM